MPEVRLGLEPRERPRRSCVRRFVEDEEAGCEMAPARRSPEGRRGGRPPESEDRRQRATLPGSWSSRSSFAEMELSPTKLAYFDVMLVLESTATLLSHLQEDGGLSTLIVDSTIFHPEGGGQPADTGFISSRSLGIKFVMKDVRLKVGLVEHYGVFSRGLKMGVKPNLKRAKKLACKWMHRDEI